MREHKMQMLTGNVAVHFLKPLVKLQHEFITDQHVKQRANRLDAQIHA